MDPTVKKLQTSTLETSPHATKQLRTYQLEMAEWLCGARAAGFRGRLCADGLGTGKALALNTPIPTPAGWTTMGALRVGDLVFGFDGRPCRVTETHDVPRPDGVFDVYFSDGEIIRACGDHLWLTYGYRARKALHRGSSQARDGVMYGAKECATRERVWTTRAIAETVNGINGREHAVQMNGVLETEIRSLPLDPYLLGVWLGDGHSRQAAITVHASEDAIAQAFASFHPRRAKQKGLAVTWLFSRELSAILKTLQVHGNKHVPDDYLWGSAQQRLALIQGLMDTDGTVNKSGTCTFDNTNERIVDALMLLCASLGIRCSKSVKFPKITGRPNAVCAPCFRVHFTTTQQVFRHSKFKLARLPTKIRKTHQWRYIDRVVPVASSEPMRCITVDSPDSLYLCGKSLVVTHNTLSLLAAARLALQTGMLDTPLMLCVTSANSVFDWVREAKAFWPELVVVTIDSGKTLTKRKKETAEEFAKRKDDAFVNAAWKRVLRAAANGELTGPYLIIGDHWWTDPVVQEVTAMNREREAAQLDPFFIDGVLIDEYHNYKKAGSRRENAVAMLTGMSRLVMAATATPAQDRAKDVFNLLKLLDPKRHTNLYKWAKSYFHFETKEVEAAGRSFTTIGGVKERELLNAALRPYIWGRQAQDVMGEMPARNHIVKYVDVKVPRVSPAKLRVKKTEQIQEMLGELVATKFDAVIEFAESLDKPAVLYTYRPVHAEELASKMKSAKLSCLTATGNQTPKARDKVIEQWKQGEAQFLVCSMDAVRESATLTRADTMVFVDLHTMPSTVLQVQGRIDPARQPANERRPVSYVYFVTKNGPDEVVAETLVTKLSELSGLGVQNKNADAFAEFLKPLDKRPGVEQKLDDTAVMALLVERINARADRLADLGML